MRPPNDDFCLQVPNSSDYLIPLPDSRTIAERILSEGTGITLAETMTSNTPIEMRPVSIIDKSPRINRNPISFGDISPSAPFDVRPTQTDKISQSNQQIASNLSNSSDKLISLDTPQQTPTTMKPPIMFGDLASHSTQLSNINEQYIDGNGNGQIDKNNSNNNHQTNTSSNTNSNINKTGVSNGPITLNPSTLESYANVRMMSTTNAQHDPSIIGNTTNSGNNNDIVDKSTPPFTIQGYDRYTSAKENHSEISC